MTRIEKLVAVEPDHGSAMGHGAGILALLGETDRAKEWAQRALLLDPDNTNLHYNLACAMTKLRELDLANDMLERVFRTPTEQVMRWARNDNDLDPLRNNPRFKALMAKAEAALSQAHRELENCGRLLADLRAKPFAIRAVRDANAPDRLQSHIRVSGWEPVSVGTTISNPKAVIGMLGGQLLYEQEGLAIERAQLAVRTARLKPESLDLDYLDEKARALLAAGEPGELFFARPAGGG